MVTLASVMSQTDVGSLLATSKRNLDGVYPPAYRRNAISRVGDGTMPGAMLLMYLKRHDPFSRDDVVGY